MPFFCFLFYFCAMRYLLTISLFFISFQVIAPGRLKAEKKYYMLNSNEQIVLDTLTADGYTKEAAAAVMGVVGGESNFNTLKEASYRNTANSRIRAIFPARLGSMPDAQLNTLKQSDEAFFNAVYGGMYGNAANEGYKYVGRGFNGITFKANYQAAAQATGIDFVNRPELLEQPRNAAKALSAYFASMKKETNLEQAFQKAYTMNAGAGRTFSFYSSSPNPVHRTGIPLKREKAAYYFNTTGGRAALFFFISNSSSTDILFSQAISTKEDIKQINEYLKTLNL